MIHGVLYFETNSARVLFYKAYEYNFGIPQATPQIPGECLVLVLSSLSPPFSFCMFYCVLVSFTFFSFGFPPPHTTFSLPSLTLPALRHGSGRQSSFTTSNQLNASRHRCSPASKDLQRRSTADECFSLCSALQHFILCDGGFIPW